MPAWGAEVDGMNEFNEALHALPRPPKGAAAAYRGALPRLVQQVNELLASHPELGRILGGVPVARMEQNHLHHAQFMADVLESGDFPLLGRVLVWAYHAYTAHGVSPRYFELEIPAWMQAIRRCIRPEEAASILPVYETIRQHHAALTATKSQPLFPPLAIPDAHAALAEATTPFLRAILAGDHRAAYGLLHPHAKTPESLAAVFDWVVRPALYEVGAMWESNAISVVDEHLASGVVRQVLAVLIAEAGAGEEGRKPEAPTVLVSAGEQEAHEIATQMISAVFTKAGWRVRLLGPDMPFPELLGEIRARPPTLLALSVTMPFHYHALHTFLDALRETVDPSVPVLLGGSFFSLFTNMEVPPAVLGIAPTLTDGLALARGVLA